MTAIFVSGALMTTFNQPQEDAATVEKREAARAERVEKLIARICKASPLGKKIVESAIERGISIGIDSGKADCLGSYMPSMRYVSLNETASDEKLLSTIVHECRHSEQTPTHNHSYSVYSNIAEVRALEADAMAHECAAVYQMRKAEPATYAAFCERHGGMMKAYEASFEHDKDMTKAKSEAFKAWYDHAEYVENYDKSVIDFMGMGMLYAGAYKKELSPKHLAAEFDYVDGAFFDSARANTVSEKTATNAAKVERAHVRHVLKLFNRSKIKTSADYFYVRTADGKVEPPKRRRFDVVAAKAMTDKGR